MRKINEQAKQKASTGNPTTKWKTPKLIICPHGTNCAKKINSNCPMVHFISGHTYCDSNSK